MRRADAWIQVFNQKFLQGFLAGYDQCLHENQLGRYADDSDEFDESGNLNLDDPDADDSNDGDIRKYINDYED